MPDVRSIVYVIDQDQAARESLAGLIGSAGLTVESFAEAGAFLDRCARATPLSAGCVIADCRLPWPNEQVDFQDRCRQCGVELPLIVVSGCANVAAAVRAMRAGAVDFIEKPFDPQVLLDRVREALKRDEQRRRVGQQLADLRARIHRLSTRERQVMDGVVQGKLNKQIASELALSPKTVEVHRAHVMSKMEAASLAELVRIVVSVEGLVAFVGQHRGVGGNGQPSSPRRI